MHQIKVALVVQAAVVVQRSEGPVDEFAGGGIMAVLGGRPRLLLAPAGHGALCQCTMSLVTLGPSRALTSELSLVIGALLRGWRMPTALGLAGLVSAVTWLAIGVHVHGGNGVRRSDRIVDRKQRPPISRP